MSVRIADLAGRLVQVARASRHKHGGVDAFMHSTGSPRKRASS
jgi:hypothetical protein